MDPGLWGPLITDSLGGLVWDGNVAPFNLGHAMSYAPGTYQNQSVLALWQGQIQPGGWGTGYGLILNDKYEVVANVSACIPGHPEIGVDIHEFTLTDNDTVLITGYNVEPYDLSPWGMEGNASDKILGGYAQEIDVATGDVLFTWRSLDHVKPEDCYTTPEEGGVPNGTVWDYFVGSTPTKLTLAHQLGRQGRARQLPHLLAHVPCAVLRRAVWRGAVADWRARPPDLRAGPRSTLCVAALCAV